MLVTGTSGDDVVGLRGRAVRPRRPVRDRSARARRASTSLAAILAALLVVLGLATACSGPPPAPAPEPTCSLPDPRPTLVPGSLVLPKDPTVLILGDSYTEGYGAEPETKGWAYLVGKPLGWTVTVNGVGGTGYVNPGPRNEGTYLQRLAAMPAGSFDLVVLQGGSNDRDVPYLALQDAVARTVDAVRAKFPGTVVLLMGPATPYGKPDGPRVVSQCVLAGYGAQQHLPFIDPQGESWFVDGDGSRYANPVNGHPSNAGYRVIAKRFEADTRILLGTTKGS